MGLRAGSGQRAVVFCDSWFGLFVKHVRFGRSGGGMGDIGLVTLAMVAPDRFRARVAQARSRALANHRPPDPIQMPPKTALRPHVPSQLSARVLAPNTVLGRDPSYRGTLSRSAARIYHRPRESRTSGGRASAGRKARPLTIVTATSRALAVRARCSVAPSL